MAILTFARAAAAFGLKKYQALRTRLWAEDRGALMFDALGSLGSGVFIELSDGTEAVLTAKHVVVDSICTGELTVQRWGALKQSLLPAEIWIDSTHDAAVIVCHALGKTGKVVPRSEWRFPPPLPQKGQGVQCSGAPGEFKSAPNLADRTVHTIKWLALMTTVTDASREVVACDVDESQCVPSTFGGMSGGPAIVLERRLFGINVTEQRRLTSSDGKLNVLPLESFLAFIDSLHGHIVVGLPAGEGKGALYSAEAISGPVRGTRVLLDVGYRRYLRTVDGTHEVAVRIVRVAIAPVSSTAGIAVRLAKTVVIDPDTEWEDVGNAALSALGMGNYAIVVADDPA
jgi:hypothetical protein